MKKVAVIVGSVREGSNSLRAAKILCDQIEKSAMTTDLIDPAGMNLSCPGQEQDTQLHDALQARVKTCEGIILVTPEYHGSYSSVMKLLIEHLGYPSVMAGKPIHLLGVASGTIGAVKSLEHLRSVCSHLGCLVLPMCRSISGVHKIFDDHGVCTDDAADYTPQCY